MSHRQPGNRRDIDGVPRLPAYLGSYGSAGRRIRKRDPVQLSCDRPQCRHLLPRRPQSHRLTGRSNRRRHKHVMAVRSYDRQALGHESSYQRLALRTQREANNLHSD